MKQSITQKMAGRWKYLLFICMFMLSTLSGFADHFRYGSLTWQRVPGNPLAVKFTLRNAFRLSLWTSQNLPVTIGSTIQTANFKPGQGANIPAIYTVTAINTKDDWWYGECSAIKTYTSSDTFAAFYNVCCRILNLQNNANATTVVPSLVQVGTFNDNNDAPVVVTAPIVNFPKNKAFVSLKIPAMDPNGDPVTFSLAPVGTFGLPSTHPVDMVISNDGWLSWNTLGKNMGDLYNTSIKVTDSKGAYVYVDFLIKIVDTSSPPSFDYVNSPADGSTFNLQPGQNITFNIKVSDPSTGDTISLYAIGLPPGAGLTTTGTNPVDGTFGWTPTPDQQGTYVVTFISEDKFGVQNTTTVNFNVGYKPYFDIPTTPGNNSIFSVKPGDTLAHIIKAISPDTAAKVGLTMVSGFTSGMAFTPAFPLTPTNPVSTNFKWVPQMSDWGTRTVVYQAIDTFRKQPVYDTIHYVIDNPPVITSTPDTNVNAGSTYTYILSATDVDIPMGDKLKVENITLPSFLSIVSNNNNTWTISGTPGVGDVGIHNIMIEVADSMNHKFGTHDGNAYQYIPLHVKNVPLNATATVSNATIYNTNTGGINLTPTGGVGPYTFSWSNSATTEDLTNVPAGTYTVTITDANNTTFTGTYTVGQPAQLTVAGTAGDVTIFGGNNGSVDITAAGGVGPYSYVWSSTATTEDINGVIAGTYSVTVTDANGATATGNFTVNQPAQLTATATVNNATIYNTNTGSIDITPAGGVGPYTYVWSNTATTQDLTNIGAGTYTVIITDANGATYTATYTVGQPAQLTVAGTVSNVTIFGGNNGGVNITPEGGVGPYTYVWSSTATTEDINGVIAGTYSVTVTDANGATATGNFTVNQPAQLTATATVNNATIYNTNTGSIDITPAGGVGPYTYVWSNTATTQDLANIGAGTYTVTITDANGATYTQTYTVGQPAQLTVAGTVSNVTIFGGNNGGVNITPAGGVGPYTYVWSNTATTEDINGVIAGTYSVTVTDANGATATGNFTVTQPTQVTVTGVVTNVTTYGGNNGAINITAAGGVGPYTYLWNNNSTIEDRTGLTAGTYSVTVKDANNATATATFTVTQPAGAPLAATIAVSPVYTVTGHAPYTIYKDYGSQSVTLTASATGGTPGYSYSWSPTTGLSSPNSAVTSAAPQATTTYTVTVTDANNNTTTVTKTISVIDVRCGNNMNNPKVLVCHRTLSCNSNYHNHTSNCYDYHNICVSDNAVATHLAHGDYLGECMDVDGTTTNVACNGSNTGAINMTVTGGSAPYTYSWSNNATTEDISGLAAGTYTVTVTGADNRTVSKSFTVCQPSVLNATATVSNACYGSNNGSINLSVSGGTSPYTYLWNNNSTSQDRNNLSAGTYSVVITDNKGCSVTKTFTVTQPSAPIALNASLTHVSCNGGENGAIDLSVSGGAGPYSYNWNLGSNNNNCNNWWYWWCNNNCNNNNNSASTQDVNGLGEGNYSVTVTDANGCTATATYTINEPSAISVNVSKSNVTCKDGNNGTITLSVSGGTAPYSYNWGNNITTQNRNGLTAGNHTVIVTDSKGCTKSVTTSISQPSSGMNVSASVTNIQCKSSSTGGINISVSGGNSPYTYSWTGGATSQDISNKPAGTYNVTITDNNGCSVVKTYTITEPATALSISAVVSNVTCKGGDNGAINLSVSGGKAPYDYNWNTGNNNSCNNNSNDPQDIDDLDAGTYTVTVTDDNGCSVTGTYTVTEPATALSLSASVTNPTCSNVNGGAINLTVNGGSSPYTYNWYNGSNWCSNNNNVTTQDRTGLSGGTYTVKVTDANGCTKTQSYTVSQPVNNISASISVSPTVTVTTGQSYTIYKGYGQQYVTLSANVSGGNNGYTFSWSPSNSCSNSNSASTTVSPNSTTTYTVTITSSTGCTKTVSKTIVVEDVRCGSNDEKVLVCKNNQTKCISQSQVSSYLSNGYQIGECSNNCKTNEGSEAEQDNEGLNTLVAKDIKVYPNPSNGIFMIELPEGTTSANVIITDMNGRIIERKAVTEASSLQVNMSGVAQGMYLIQVAAGAETYQSRITIK